MVALMLFVGAFVQWSLSTIVTLATVQRRRLRLFLSMLALQTLWAFNITGLVQAIVRGDSRWYTVAWALGAACGCVVAVELDDRWAVNRLTSSG